MVEPGCSVGRPGGEARSPPDFLLESSSRSGRQQSPPLPALDLEVGAGGMLGSILEALLKFAAPGRTSQRWGCSLGFSGTQSANAGGRRAFPVGACRALSGQRDPSFLCILL